MTEEEAKTKWCPHVRVADCGAHNAVACNRFASESISQNCIASNCMMWVKRHQAGVDKKGECSGYCGLTNR